MPKIAYLVIAHNNPAHVRRLLDALTAGEDDIYLHIDAKSNLADFAYDHSQVCFTQRRVSVHWGDWTQVEAQRALLETIFARGAKYDRYVLLSGACYPLASMAQICRFFTQYADREFIEMIPFPNEELGKQEYKMSHYNIRATEPEWRRFLLKVGLRFGLVSRMRDYQKELGQLKPYGGAAWWALTDEAVRYVMDFYSANPDIVKFFQHTHIPDELVVQVILGSSPLAPKIFNRSLTHCDWSEQGSNPSFFYQGHLPTLCQLARNNDKADFDGLECLFARKFDNDSAGLVGAIDDTINAD